MSNKKSWSDYSVGKRPLLGSVLPLKTDSYKIPHWKMLPSGTTNMFSYGESRGPGKNIEKVVFFGIQAIIKKFLMKKITMDDLIRAERFARRHLRPGAFNYEGWKYVVEQCNGYLPLSISAIPEGTVLSPKNALYSIEATDPKCAWAVSYFEPLTLQVWYPTTVASLSYSIRNMISEFWKETVDDDRQDGINFALHDFGYRGASSDESAGIGDSGHLLNFLGTDTMAGICVLYDYYGLDEDDDSSMPAFSVHATEHTIMCSNSDAEHKNDYGALEMAVSLLETECAKNDGYVIVSAVADTYDVYRFSQWVGNDFFERIKNSGGRFVVRPDSGDATVVPVQIIELLMQTCGYTINKKGYKVLPDCIRVLQGDGVNYDSIKQILLNLRAKGISAENIVFGMGGALLQGSNRDTMRFAQKASAIEVDGTWKDVFKDPVTDAGKTSKKGRLTVVKRSGEIITIRIEDVRDTDEILMREIFRNGQLLIDDNFNDIKKRVMSTL
ncbi:MAG TPA: nicotinate phosphoribosyltransferase [Methanosarcina sp.]|nr:nicotinate phosphoribosyltransferase [Methanosarcina sp.]